MAARLSWRLFSVRGVAGGCRSQSAICGLRNSRHKASTSHWSRRFPQLIKATSGMRKDLPAHELSASWLQQIVARADPQGKPRIEMIKRAAFGGPRLGVFASSFNPVTIAHIELMRRALAERSEEHTSELQSRFDLV